MREVIVGAIVGMLMCWFIFILTMAAVEARGADLTNASFSASKMHNYRNPAAPKYTILGNHPEGGTETWEYQLDLNLDLSIIKTETGELYWDQNIQAQSTTVQYRRIHWDFEVGYTLHRKVGVFWHHRSEHFLDIYDQDYPLHDVYGVRFCLLDKGSTR